MVFENAYIKVLNYIYKVTHNVPYFYRVVLQYVFVATIVASIFVSHSMKFIGFVYPETLKCFVGGVSLGLFIIFSIDEPLERIEWNRIIVIGVFICGFLMFVTGIMHHIGYSYMMLGLIIAFEFPALYLVWLNKNDYGSLYLILSRVICIAAVLYMIACIIYAPIGNGDLFSVGNRYAGTTSNPNTLGMIGAVFVAVGIYSVLCESICFYRVLGTISIGVGVLFIIESASRTGLVAAVCVLIMAIIIVMLLIFNKKNVVKVFFIRLIVFVIICILTIVSGIMLLERNVELEDGGSDQYYIEHVETDENTTLIQNRMEKGISADGQIDVNHMSSGRIELWTAYLKTLNLFGNDVIENPVTYGYGSDDAISYAHNTSLEYAYRSGIIVGGLFLFLEIISGIWALLMSFSINKRNRHIIFSVLSIVCFGIISLLDVAVMPFSSLPLFVFWMGILPLFKKENKYNKERRNV